MKALKICLLTMVSVCTGLIIGAAIAPTVNADSPQVQFDPEFDYCAYADELNLIEIMDADDVNIDLLENRNGKLIIERCIGIVDDAEAGDGHVINEDPDCNYISYRGVDGVATGNVVCTYFIYNPDTNYFDDIMMRFDYIIDSCAVEN